MECKKVSLKTYLPALYEGAGSMKAGTFVLHPKPYNQSPDECNSSALAFLSFGSFLSVLERKEKNTPPRSTFSPARLTSG